MQIWQSHRKICIFPLAPCALQTYWLGRGNWGICYDMEYEFFFPEEAVTPEADIKCSFSLDFLPTFYGPFKGK